MIAWKTENFSLIILELKLGNNIMIKKYYDRRIKMKKIKNLICLLFVCVLFSLFFACTEEKKTVELVDFENQSHTVNLGEMYTIDLTSVRDKDGNTYRVLYEVKTKSGGSVSVLENVFDITDVEGYVITYTVHVDKKTTLFVKYE